MQEAYELRGGSGSSPITISIIIIHSSQPLRNLVGPSGKARGTVYLLAYCLIGGKLAVFLSVSGQIVCVRQTTVLDGRLIIKSVLLCTVKKA